MIKVYIAPDYSKNPSETGGIRRVVDAQVKYLPEFDIEVVHDPNKAHIIINHGGMNIWRPGVPSISVCHGLYWSRQPWGDNFKEVNQQVVESMCRAVAHTVPSEWVGTAVRRGGFFYPEVVYHGVDCSEFVPVEHPESYVVWAKARADYVSNPDDMNKVAQLLPGRKFVSTCGKESGNVEIVGSLPYFRMTELVENAWVYLSTARETFGIGTLEALACGVPIAGWDCGGNSEIVIQGETGYLAPWGDFKTLAECIEKCYAEHERLSANCIEDARTRWQWKPRIGQYANIIKRVYDRYYKRGDKPRVSVIVTAYKLDKYLPDCLQSIQKQSYADFECIVVDDAQLDSTQAIVRAVAENDNRFKYTPTPNNFGLPGARNFGVDNSRGLFIRHMDADDTLAENALELEVTALEQDDRIHIAYGHIEVVNEDGSRRMRADGTTERCGWPPDEFNWYQQMAHLNQIPSACMARREVFGRSGGYRERMKRNEDAEFWCRVTSLGFRAKKITQAVTMFHRERADSKGATEWKNEGSEKDWTAWFPWRIGACTPGEGWKKYNEYGDCHPLPHLVPFSAQSKPGTMRMWYVHDFAYPVVSVIITCGPGHKQYLIDALDSVQAQTYPDWECIVVNDTGESWNQIAGAPYARIVNMDGNQGVSNARNEGFRYAKGKYIVWLDADDYWMPWFLEKMISTVENNPGVIYSDFVELNSDDGKEHFKNYRYALEFDPRALRNGCAMPGSSILIPRKLVEDVITLQGGWDKQIIGMEDWDYQVALRSLCACFYHIQEPLFVYRTYSTTKRVKDYNRVEEIRHYMDDKWIQFWNEGVNMGCGCGGRKKSTGVKSTLQSSGNFTLTDSNASVQEMNMEMVDVEYMGENSGAFSINSRARPGLSYRFGTDQAHKIRSVFRGDLDFLTSMTNPLGQPLYRVVQETKVTESNPATFLGAAIE